MIVLSRSLSISHHGHTPRKTKRPDHIAHRASNGRRPTANPVFLLVTLCCLMLPGFVVGQDRPNIVLIFIDDLGWSDVGCYGNDFVDTPRIDQLAKEGIRFTDFYASGNVCSATRCGLQSGQNQARIGITDFIPGHWRPFERVITPRPRTALPLEIETIGESLKRAGYSTGYIGKWHLGGPRFQPAHQGYDFSAVINGPHLPGRYRVQNPNVRQPRPDQYRTDYEADLSIDFIRQHKQRPFFLMLSPFAVHIPLAGMSDKVAKYRAKAKAQGRTLPHPVYAAMIEHCDEMVGRIVDCLEEQGLTGQTAVLFTSDNGGLIKRYDYRPEADDIVSSLAPLKGEKGSLYEGGIRIPLIVKYPAMIKPGGVCDEPAVSHDFFSTFVELADGSLPVNQANDGESLVPLFKDPQAELDRESIFWHYPHYHHHRPATAIRQGDWKLIEYIDGTKDVELYNLRNDIGETHNLASQTPELVRKLKRSVRQFRADVVAEMPIPNPSYDPKRADQWWSTRTNKPVASSARKRFPATEKEAG